MFLFPRRAAAPKRKRPGAGKRECFTQKQGIAAPDCVIFRLVTGALLLYNKVAIRTLTGSEAVEV